MPPYIVRYLNKLVTFDGAISWPLLYYAAFLIKKKVNLWKNYSTNWHHIIHILKADTISFPMVYDIALGTLGWLNSFTRALFGLWPLAYSNTYSNSLTGYTIETIAVHTIMWVLVTCTIILHGGGGGHTKGRIIEILDVHGIDNFVKKSS
jgi:hypothetical protein